MKKSRKVKILSTPSIPSLEPLEARLLLSAVDVGVTTVLPLETSDTTPALIGTVGDNTAEVQVILKQGGTTIGTWDAIEDGMGGWEFTLPGPDALLDGVYDIFVTATANGGSDYGEFVAESGLMIDATAPVVTVNTLATNVVSPELTGTVDDPAATVSVNVGGVDYAATNNGDGIWTLAAGQIADLTEGAYDVAVTGTDTAGNADTDGDATELVIDLTAPIASTTTTITAGSSPALSGAVDDSMATVTVTVRGNTYTAINNGDGAWTLPEGTMASLPNGLYKLVITVADPAGNEQTDSTSYLLVDNTGPLVTVDKTLTTDTTPAPSGTVNDNVADIVVIINGSAYSAVNNGDGTWTLPDNTVASLGEGIHSVTVAATDALDNTGTADGVLSIASAVGVTLGAGIFKVTYADADDGRGDSDAGHGV